MEGDVDLFAYVIFGLNYTYCIHVYYVLNRLLLNISSRFRTNGYFWKLPELGSSDGFDEDKEDKIEWLFSSHTALSRRPHLPMPETGDYLKSLKPFREILVSSEANYRNAAANERGVITGEIMAEIHEAAGKNRAKLADDDTLQKVSGCVALHCRP